MPFKFKYNFNIDNIEVQNSNLVFQPFDIPAVFAPQPTILPLLKFVLIKLSFLQIMQKEYTYFCFFFII